MLSYFSQENSMERELWRWIADAVRRMPPTRPRNAVYTDPQIVAVYLWAALHDRPVSWACERANWPPQAWRRVLPDQSTMSRRMRHASVIDLQRKLLHALQRKFGESGILVVDGKPLELSEHTRDPDAATGRGAGRFAKGYKLHLVLDAQTNAVIDFRVHPLNVAETKTIASIMRDPRTPIRRQSLVLGDRLYDSNELYGAVHERGCRLIAPRRRPNGGLGSHRHHPARLSSIRLTEGPDAIWDDVLAPHRAAIERFLGTLTSFNAGLKGLPAWARRLHRVRPWIAAKLVINAARIRARGAVAA